MPLSRLSSASSLQIFFCFGLLEIRFLGSCQSCRTSLLGLFEVASGLSFISMLFRPSGSLCYVGERNTPGAQTPGGCGWAAGSAGPVFGEEAGCTRWLVRGPHSFCPQLPCRSNKPELCWEGPEEQDRPSPGGEALDGAVLLSLVSVRHPLNVSCSGSQT